MNHHNTPTFPKEAVKMISTKPTNSKIVDTLIEDSFDWLEIYEKAMKEGDLQKASLALKNVEIARTQWEEIQGI